MSSWQRLRVIRFRQNAKSLIDDVQRRIDELRAELPAERSRYWLYYNEVKRLYLATAEWKYIIRDFEDGFVERAERSSELEQIVPTAENYQELVSRIAKHNADVNLFRDQVRKVLVDIYDATDAMATIRERAGERDWRMPGRPTPMRKFETFLDITESILRALRRMEGSYVSLLEDIDDLIVEPPEKPPSEKLFRVQLMFTVTALPPTSDETPEPIAEIRAWYYTYAPSREIAEAMFSQSDAYNSIMAVINQEYGDAQHVFESLYGALQVGRIEISPSARHFECDEIDEDEPIWEVGAAWEEEKFYHAFSFYKVDRFFRTYDQRWIDETLVGFYDFKKPGAAKTLAQKALDRQKRLQRTADKREEERKRREADKEALRKQLQEAKLEASKAKADLKVAERERKEWNKLGVPEGNYLMVLQGILKLSDVDRGTIEKASEQAKESFNNPYFLQKLKRYRRMKREQLKEAVTLLEIMMFAEDPSVLSSAIDLLKGAR